jgi:hypothetical protein
LLPARSVAVSRVTYSAAMAKLALLAHPVNKDQRVPTVSTEQMELMAQPVLLVVMERMAQLDQQVDQEVQLV